MGNSKMPIKISKYSPFFLIVFWSLLLLANFFYPTFILKNDVHLVFLQVMLVYFAVDFNVPQ